MKDENDEVLEKRIFLVGFGAELVSHDHYTALGSDYLLSLALILFFWTALRRKSIMLVCNINKGREFIDAA